MNPGGRWRSGAPVLVQEVWEGRVWSARPMIVAADTGDTLLLWMPAGTPWKAPDSPRSRPRSDSRAERISSCLTLGDWVYVDRSWRMNTLWLLRRQDHYAVWVCWTGSGEHIGWYVNFQRPFDRGRTGVQYMDLMLDMRVAPGGSWSWKDADELALLVKRGLIPDETARTLRREGEALTGLIESGRPPFGDSMLDWRPDPAWPRPGLPPHWDSVDCQPIQDSDGVETP